MQPYGERVGIKVRSKKDFAAVHQAHKELAAEAEGRALESYPHLASTRNYKPKIAKSEPRKKIMGSDKYPRRPAGEPVDDPMVARSADRTYEWGPAEIQRKRFPNQPPLYDPSRGKKIKINRGEEAEVGDHLDDFGMIHQIVKISKDGRTVTTDSPKGRRDHHVSAFAHTFKVPPPTQKSESRAAILARGILAAVELRKAHYGTGRGKYPRPWKDNQSGRMHQDLTHLLPEQYHATHSMEASWLPGMPQHVSAKVTYKHPSYGTSEALGFTSHGGAKEWYEGSGAASQHSKAHEIQPHADAAFGRFLQSKMMAPHHPDRG
jgi:hypothetical protein